MSPAVKAALISEIGGLVYLALWIVAMQAVYAYYVKGDGEQAWVVKGWRWWEARGARKWARTVEVYHRTPGDELPFDILPEITPEGA